MCPSRKANIMNALEWPEDSTAFVCLSGVLLANLFVNSREVTMNLEGNLVIALIKR